MFFLHWSMWCWFQGFLIGDLKPAGLAAAYFPEA
jgi:hypothetical protein